MPGIQIPTPNLVPVPVGDLEKAKLNLSNAQRLYREAVIARATDPSFVVASSTHPDSNKTLYVITLSAAEPHGGTSYAERCAEECAYLIFDRQINDWTDISIPPHGSSVISSVPTWLSPDKLLFTYSFGDGPMWAQSFFAVDTDGPYRPVGESESYSFEQDSVHESATRANASLTFRSSEQNAPIIRIRWSESRQAWTALVTGKYPGDPTVLATVNLPNPPSSPTSWADGAILLPTLMANGEAGIAFSWFGSIYVLQGERLTPKK